MSATHLVSSATVVKTWDETIYIIGVHNKHMRHGSMVNDEDEYGFAKRSSKSWARWQGLQLMTGMR